MARGIQNGDAGADIDCCPIGDGGEGTLDVLAGLQESTTTDLVISGPYGEKVSARICYVREGEYAFIESAMCIGLQLVPADKRDPTKTSSYGVGELILRATEHAETIVVGIGGSLTNDGGCGMAQALGYRFLDARGRLLPGLMSGGMLLKVARIDASQRASLLQRVRLTVASDVGNPLTGKHGAAHTYAAQKGADPIQTCELEDGLAHLASLIRRDLGTDIENLAGSGAAGGLGGGLVAFAGAQLRSGIDFVLDAVDFARRVRGCDLCFTGEGRIDVQSLAGKACMGVARAAASNDVATIAFVGSIGNDAHLCLDAGLHRIVDISRGLPIDESISRAAELISVAAAAEVRRAMCE